MARQFIDGGKIDPLLVQLDRFTDIQAAGVIEKHGGKWAQASGTVLNATRHKDSVTVSLFVPRTDNSRAWSVLLIFEKDHPGALVLLKDDLITVQGRISRSTKLAPCLQDCEIVSHKSGGDIALEGLLARFDETPTAKAEETKVDGSDSRVEPAKVEERRSSGLPKVEADKRKNLPTPEAEKFCKLLLDAWPSTTERVAHQKALAFFSENKVPKHWFLEIFRAIRGDKNPGPQPKNGKLNH